MSEHSYTLVQQWLQQSAIDNDNLQQLVADYPSFSAAQLLLFKRLDEGSQIYATQKNIAALHVYHPIQLKETKTFDFPFEPDKEIRETPEPEVIRDEPISLEEKEADTFENATSEPTVVEQAFIKTEPVISEAAELEMEATDQKEKERFADSFTETSFIEEKELKEEDAAFSETTALPVAEEKIEEGIQEEAAMETAVEEPQIKMPSFDLSAPVNMPAGDITFEPFHTVDYFASQGIKLSQTEAGNDRFGKQVKSFTEWLKTMKKLPATALTQNTDGVGESKVVNLAAHSLQNADVVTESMAEVWVKQGNIQKASEVYNKLSLQNPSKKAYFAAKIESLKKPF